MNMISNLERKFRGKGINNLTMYIIACYVVGYLLSFISPQMIMYLTLEPALILRGQVWRLVTWVLIPPTQLSIFTIIMLLFYYQLGTALERAWGEFRYTLYICSGLVFTIIGAFILYFIVGGGVGFYFSTYYISMSIFLAFAASYPDMQIMLYFVFPIKIKWMAFLNVALLLYDGIRAARRGAWPLIVVIVASLLNFIVFFLMTKNLKRYTPKEVHRRQSFKKAVSRGQAMNRAGVTKHKCAICGQTEEDNPDLEFRFCSKCNGNYEYCQNHLFTHKHVQ